MKRLQNILSGFVLVIFSLYLVPHELVHGLYHHRDTQHATSTDGKAHLSSIHIHCNFLYTDALNFLPGYEVGQLSCDAHVAFHYSVIPVADVAAYGTCTGSRGPPFLV